MYSTKRVNKGLVEGNAFITIGDKYHARGDKLPERWGGKGFAIPAKPQNAENGNFSKLLYAGDKYAEMERFSLTQKNRKLGFGTKDAFRRGEFTATIRTEQYRDLLKREQRLIDSKRNPEVEEEVLARAEEKYNSTRTFPSHLKETRFLYDIGRNQVTEFDPKSGRDRFYTLRVDQEKRMGGYRTMSQDIGDGAHNWKYQSPEFGPVHHTKFFSDKSHLEVAGM